MCVLSGLLHLRASSPASEVVPVPWGFVGWGWGQVGWLSRDKGRWLSAYS